ncbi:MAG: hypothetical protein NTV86_00190 [Planctomycetota bacterium]|nr:hypothetical protein [Planctomycetota bacterium]
MADTQGIRAGRAFVELLADDSKLQAGLKKAAARLKGWGKAVTGAGKKLTMIGGAIVAPMMLAARAFASSGDQLAEMSARTGASVESLSLLSFAAMKTGVDMETLETGIKRMQKTLFQAATGSKSAQKALGMLGLTIADLSGLSPDEQFQAIGDRLSQIQDPAIKAALAMQIFGKAGTGMLPMMEGGAAAFQRYRDRLAELGGPTTTASAEAGHELSKTMEDLHFATGRATKSIGAALAPVITKITNDIIRITVAATAWIKANQSIVVGLFQVAKYVVIAGTALVVLGYAIKGLGVAMLGLRAAFAVVNVGIQALVGTLAFLVTPFGMVVGAAIGLGAALLLCTEVGSQALTWLGEAFAGLYDDAVYAFGGIADALSAGDIGLAAKILWDTLKVWWLTGVAAIRETWATGLGGMGAFFAKVWGGVRLIWENVTNGLCIGWVETIAALKQGWASFCGWVAKAWVKTSGWLEKAWNSTKELFGGDSAEEANKEVDRETEMVVAGVDEEVAARKSAIEAKRKAQREAGQKIHDDETNKILDETMTAENAARDKDAKALAEANANLAAAKKVRDADIAAAKEKKRLADEEREKKKKSAPDTKAMAEKLAAGLAANVKNGGLADMASAAGEAKGTWNASSVLGLQAAGIDERLRAAAEATADATEETASNTAALLAQNGFSA